MRGRPLFLAARLLLSLTLLLFFTMSASAGPATSPSFQASGGLEPNNSFGRAAPIAATGASEESIQPQGDVDWYRIQVENQGELQIAITNVAPELNIAVRVWDSEYRDISGWFGPLENGLPTQAIVDLPEAGRYLLEVRDSADDAEATQPYSLQLIFTASPVAGEYNNNLGTATPLTFDIPQQATILPRGDSDWYKIHVESHGELQVAVTNVPENVGVVFRVWNGEYQDISGWFQPMASASGTGGETRGQVDLPGRGFYYIEVRDQNDDSRSVQPYTLFASFSPTVDAFEPNNSAGRASTLLLDSSVDATILPRGDSDWYRINVEEHGELRVTITDVAAELDIVFRVWDAELRDISGWFAPAAKGSDTTATIDLPTPGSYLLEVRDSSDDSRSLQPYRLQTQYTPVIDPFEPNNSFGKATFLGVNRKTQANILPRNDSDWYRFAIDHQGEVSIALTSVAPDLALSFRLWDAEYRDYSGWFGAQVEGADTVGRIDLAFPGEYVIEVRDGSSERRSTDPYDLSVDFSPTADPFEPNNSFESAMAVGLDQRVVGNILPAGDVDWYRVEVAEAGNLHVLIANIAPELEVAFRLWNSAEQLVSGWFSPLTAGQNTAGIIELMEAGVYYLEVVGNRSDTRSLQPYHLYLSMEPIDPTSVVILAPPPITGSGTGSSGSTGATGEVTATATITPPSDIKIRVSGQAGPQGVDLFVREPQDLEANGARLQIPAGALDNYTTIHIGTTSVPPADAPYGIFPAGKYWVFDPEGLQFKVPVTLTLPVPPASAIEEMFVGHWDGTEWEDLGGMPEDGLVSVQVDGFSYFGVFCGAFDRYQRVALRNDTSSEFLTITYLSGPQPEPDQPQEAAAGCPSPYDFLKRWELDRGESAHLLLRPGLYQVEVAYPTPQPGVSNPLLFRVPPNGGEQTISITDEGATSDDPDALIVFAGRDDTAGTNHRPIITCSATVPPGVAMVNGDPAATALPSRVVVIGQGDPVKIEQFPPNGPGIQFMGSATDAEGGALRTFWTVRGVNGASSTIVGETMASGDAIPDNSNFTLPKVAGRYTVFLTIYDQFMLFDECRWVIDVVPNAKPVIDVFSGRVHVEFGRLDQERFNVGPIPPVPATLRPGVVAPLPVTLPNGTTAIWSGLTLCPTAIAGPLAVLPMPDAAVTTPAPVDVMLPPTTIPSNDPNAPAEDVTHLWAFPGRTCVWAMVADADLDPVNVKWEFPGPIFGSGTFYAAVDIPAGFHPDAPEGMPLGTFIRTTEQLNAYNAWVSFIYNLLGVIPAIVWEGWDDPCTPGSGLPAPANPCPSAISRGGVENIVANVTDGFVQPAILEYAPIEVGPDAVEPNECGTVLFFSELRPNPADPLPGQGVEVHARLSSLTQDCPVHIMVNGTDGFAVDTTIPTNKDGEVTIFIPGGAEGVVDTVVAEVCRGPLSDLADDPPPAERCMTGSGERGWLLRIEVQYTF